MIYLDTILQFDIGWWDFYVGRYVLPKHPRTMTRIKELPKFKLGWIVGILEGEGTFCCSNSSNGTTIAVKMTDRDIVVRLKRWIGCGYVYKREREWALKNVHTWSSTQSRDNIEICKEVIPLLGERRKRQAKRLKKQAMKVTTNKASKTGSNSSSKLTKKEVRKICKYAYKAQESEELTQKLVAEAFNVCISTVSHIKRGNSRPEWTKDIREGFNLPKNTRLSDEEVREVYLSDGKLKDIAEEYGVSISTVSSIKTRRRRREATSSI